MPHASLNAAHHERAILAGGCFWGMEELIRRQDGVIGTRVGYTGGTLENPAYTDVKTGTTGHAEAVEIIFDTDVTSFEALLRFFFKMHDPTTDDRQGNDIGSQYRSAIFYTSEAQQKTAQDLIRRMDASGKWPAPIVTAITPATPFYAAENEHQDYLMKNPDGYTCHWVRVEWDF